jgi:hypothetical protein
MAAPMASPQEIVEKDAAEALANDYWERIVMRALDVRQESPDSLSSSSSPLRVHPFIMILISPSASSHPCDLQIESPSCLVLGSRSR